MSIVQQLATPTMRDAEQDEVAEMLANMHLDRAAAVEVGADFAEHIVPTPPDALLDETAERGEILVERLGVGRLLFRVALEADELAVLIAILFEFYRRCMARTIGAMKTDKRRR
ncbi:hypothetical protein G4G27_23290 [Sphingomonas sp. So64.6b]|uniref:hypothetical protein n=1 Tax=Sphingomonas sp. So64.6b TaxID=2997354 RepID=UPI001600D403|nr:hypothetical protein [Sphingomonas sp. So64.6b]QNA86575.1 hypothetical protein G4G27_23290 [Sphingomonas sp. So64.6b]